MEKNLNNTEKSMENDAPKFVQHSLSVLTETCNFPCVNDALSYVGSKDYPTDRVLIEKHPNPALGYIVTITFEPKKLSDN